MEIGLANLSLADLPAGSAGCITSVEVGGLLRRRIMDLGMLPGTQVRCVRKAPWGDPVALQVRGSIIALRAEDLRKIKISPIINREG
ncbi:MAG: ferrous iron transport protein A [Syntrophomonadaceae bacterium]|nr:ferrous iron transport protein A [Syntrophomonadaceae bacterium]